VVGHKFGLVLWKMLDEGIPHSVSNVSPELNVVPKMRVGDLVFIQQVVLGDELADWLGGFERLQVFKDGLHAPFKFKAVVKYQIRAGKFAHVAKSGFVIMRVYVGAHQTFGLNRFATKGLNEVLDNAGGADNQWLGLGSAKPKEQ
jgi:hypothetical protein